MATAPVGKAADVVVVRRDTHTDVLISSDTPLRLAKGGKTEEALLRQAISLTTTITLVRAASGVGEDTLSWIYQPRLQRQLCFTSITGQFSCAAADADDLTEMASGQVQVPASPDRAPGASAAAEPPLATTPDQGGAAPNPMADAARIAIISALTNRSAALFETDRRLKLNPMLKAAGVSVRRSHGSSASIGRSMGGAPDAAGPMGPGRPGDGRGRTNG
jgi:hypothetical protein